MVYTKSGLWILLAGVVVLARQADSLRGSALVAELKNKAKAALLNPTETIEEVVTVEGDPEGGNATVQNVTITKTKSLLTGNPQKDYIYDPNLPRELNGYNLTNYPFYNGVPEDIDFKCDDLHDGFYASVPHKCQVYHHCLFGTRYDFLCANYTAFDQRTFICHFVSEVDCDNSPKFYQRNEALYKAASTAPPIVIQTTTTTAPPPTTAATQRPRRRRPYRRRRPAYEYYYDDQYDDDEYYDDDPPPPRRKMNRKHRPSGGYRGEDSDDYHEGRRDSRGENARGEGSRSEGSRGDGGRGDGGLDNSKDMKPTVRVSGPATGTVYDKPRVPPKIRRPVPIHERDKYDYNKRLSDGEQSPTQDTKKNAKPQSNHDEYDDEYYDDEYEEEYVKRPPKRNKGGGDYSSESAGKSESRRPSSRHRPRQNSRRRPDRYEDDYEDDDRPVRSRKRPRYDDPPATTRGTRGGGNRGYSRDEPDPVPAERPGFISNSRHQTGNRKRVEDDRIQPTKKTPSRVVYEDEEDDEEYYYDEEDESQDEEVGRRNYKYSTNNGGNGRRSDDYETDNGKKSSSPNRKPSTDSYVSKHIVKSETRHQNSGGYQGEKPKSENSKPANRQANDNTTPKGVNYRCKLDCEDDYSDYSEEDSIQEKQIGNEREVSKHTTQSDNQKQINERDRLFSSRFRDSMGESKTKQKQYDKDDSGKLPLSSPSYKSTTQNPEPVQRSKPIRNKSNFEEPTSSIKTTTTSTETYADYTEEVTNSGSKYSNFRSKGRLGSPTPLVNNYKMYQNSQESRDDTNIYTKPEDESSSFITEEPGTSSKGKFYAPSRPFSGMVRRPVKTTTESTFDDESPATLKTPSIQYNYRQPSILNNDNEKQIRTPIMNAGQNYRRIKVEPPQNENSEIHQQKTQFPTNNFRRPAKPVEDSQTENGREENGQNGSQIQEEAPKKLLKPLFLDKPQQINPSFGGAYRRVKVSAMSSTTPETDISSPSYDNSQTFQDESVLNPVNSYKRPYLTGRPVNNYPVVVEDTTKNTLSSNNAYRRPLKQNTQDNEPTLNLKEYNPTSTNSGVGESYFKLEQGVGINISPSLTFFPPKRNKPRVDDTTGRGLDQYPKQFSVNQGNQYFKPPPKIEVTAPGPSAPGSDLSSVKSNYNNASPGFPLDIPEEEYDVTLNDALQPSTLHPTRSLVDYQQTRLKPRDYQSNLGRAPEYVNRGRVSFLVPAASQQYLTRIQSVYTPDKQDEDQITARYSDNKGGKKEASVDEDEYEAVVHSAPSDQWANQRRNRPTEWYW